VNDAIQQPLDLCLDILEGRAYAEAHALVKRTADESQLPDTPMIERALEYQYAHAAEVFQQKKAAQEARKAGKR
jgi:hypothetical protein